MPEECFAQMKLLSVSCILMKALTVYVHVEMHLSISGEKINMMKKVSNTNSNIYAQINNWFNVVIEWKILHVITFIGINRRIFVFYRHIHTVL